MRHLLKWWLMFSSGKAAGPPFLGKFIQWALLIRGLRIHGSEYLRMLSLWLEDHREPPGCNRNERQFALVASRGVLRPYEEVGGHTQPPEAMCGP